MRLFTWLFKKKEELSINITKYVKRFNYNCNILISSSFNSHIIINLKIGKVTINVHSVAFKIKHLSIHENL